MKGISHREHTIAFKLCLEDLDEKFITSRQIEAARIGHRYMKRKDRVIRIFPDHITKKPQGCVW